MMEGWRKYYPPTNKTLQVVFDAAKFLEDPGMDKYATAMVKSVGDCAVFAFYYLLQLG